MRIKTLAACLLSVSPLSAEEITMEDIYAAGDARTASAQNRTLTRAGAWLAAGLLSFAGNVHYARKAANADRDAQFYRDTVLAMRPVPPPYRRPCRDAGVRLPADYGPARNMEKRAEIYRQKAQLLYGAAAVSAVMAGFNLDRYLRIRADRDGGFGVSVQKRFGKH
jgi:hypothetical protein